MYEDASRRPTHPPFPVGRGYSGRRLSPGMDMMRMRGIPPMPRERRRGLPFEEQFLSGYGEMGFDDDDFDGSYGGYGRGRRGYG